MRSRRSLLAIVALLLLLTSRSASAAIAVDSTAKGTFAVALSTTWSHTTAGSDRILWVAYRILSSSDLEAGCTYNGAVMTLVQSGNHVAGPSNWAYLWVLVNPTVGVNNVVCGSDSSIGQEGLSVSYTGAKQSGQPDSSNEGSANAASLTVSTTVVATGCWLVGTFAIPGATNPDPGVGTTSRKAATDLAFQIFDSNGTVGTGSQSLQATFGSAADFYGAVASMAPVATSSTSQGLLLGVLP